MTRANIVLHLLQASDFLAADSCNRRPWARQPLLGRRRQLSADRI